MARLYYNPTILLCFNCCLVVLICFECIDEFRDDVKSIPYDAIIGDFKEWGFGVIVDHDNGFRLTYAGKMLDRAGDTNSDIQVWTYCQARLSDVLLMWAPARIGYRFGTSSSCT